MDATDPGDTLTFALDVAPAGMTINAVSGLIQWTPTGTKSVQTMSRFVCAMSAVVRDQELHRPGRWSTTCQSPTGHHNGAADHWNRGRLYSYDVDATDPDAGNILTFSLTTAPTGMTINSVSGLIQWTPAAGQVGANSVTVRVQDQGGLLATQSFTVQVSPPGNRAPFFTSAPTTTATVGQLYSYDADASDPDVGDILTFSLTAAPAGMSINQFRPESMDANAWPGRRQRRCCARARSRRAIRHPELHHPGQPAAFFAADHHI